MKFMIQPARLLRPVAFAAIFAVTSIASFARETALNYLPPATPDAAILLTPPPLINSVEQSADLETVKAVAHAATGNDLTAAHAEKKISVFSFSKVIGVFFTHAKLPKTAAFFAKVQRDASTVTDIGKDFFQRPRPFTADPSLATGNLEKSFSYPSGHSTESMALALILGELLPDQRDAIIAHARTLGWHRIQIARHYPTDIYAGRVLAQAIVRELHLSHAFNNEFAEVKAELAAAQK